MCCSTMWDRNINLIRTVQIWGMDLHTHDIITIIAQSYNYNYLKFSAGGKINFLQELSMKVKSLLVITVSVAQA